MISDFDSGYFFILIRAKKSVFSTRTLWTVRGTRATYAFTVKQRKAHELRCNAKNTTGTIHCPKASNTEYGIRVHKRCTGKSNQKYARWKKNSKN